MAEAERESSAQPTQPTAEARPAHAGPPDSGVAGGAAAAASSAAVPAGPQAVDPAAGYDGRQQDGAGMANGRVAMSTDGKAGNAAGSGQKKGSSVTYRLVRQLTETQCSHQSVYTCMLQMLEAAARAANLLHPGRNRRVGSGLGSARGADS